MQRICSPSPPPFAAFWWLPHPPACRPKPGRRRNRSRFIVPLPGEVRDRRCDRAHGRRPRLSASLGQTGAWWRTAPAPTARSASNLGRPCAAPDGYTLLLHNLRHRTPTAVHLMKNLPLRSSEGLHADHGGE